jgi:SNF2 family DNA or RNA helicase
VKEKSQPLRKVNDKGYSYKRKPMDHQRRAFALSRDRKTFGLFMEQGTGKTKVSLDTAQWLYGKGEIEALVVVAWPNGVHRNWVDYEIPADVKKPYYAEYWSSNWKTKHRQKALQLFREAPKGRGLKIFCMNVEALVSKGAQDYLLQLLTSHKCLLLIDQSASIKNPQAQRTKFLINKCSPLAPYRRVLDGQPVAEGASELFSQFKFLDPWIIGHDTWTGFKAEFCEIGFFNEIKGYRNMDKLRAKIDGYCFRVREEECLDLPPRIYKRWSFDLTEQERRIYDELKVQSLAYFSKDGQLEDDPDSLEEHNALVKNMRLQQISSGWWPLDKLRPISKPPSRLEALLSLLQSLGKDKALIFARFRADLAIIQKALATTAVSYHGGINEEDRREAKVRFMKDPHTTYFLGQPRSAGFGHTLTAAKHIIFYSNDHSLRLREECEKRVHRQGLKHRLIIWDLCAAHTHDVNILRAFRAKKELANEILSDPDNFFLQYDEE